MECEYFKCRGVFVIIEIHTHGTYPRPLSVYVNTQLVACLPTNPNNLCPFANMAMTQLLHDCLFSVVLVIAILMLIACLKLLEADPHPTGYCG
jgi:hypothetical protein